MRASPSRVCDLVPLLRGTLLLVSSMKRNLDPSTARTFESLALQKKPAVLASFPFKCVLGVSYRMKNTTVSTMNSGIRMAHDQPIYPKNEGIFTLAFSAMDFTMKLGALPM